MSDDFTEIFFEYVRKLETENRAMRLEIEKLKGNFDETPAPEPEPVLPAPKAEPILSAHEEEREGLRPASRPVPPPLPGGRSMGFEGDPCPECGSMMMTRNGSCLKCHSCGATTGCS